MPWCPRTGKWYNQDSDKRGTRHREWKHKGNPGTRGLQSIPPQPASTTPTSPNAFEDYMARSDRSPSMTDRWRAEDDDRNRHSHRPRDTSRDRDRDRDRIDRYPRSPVRRDIDTAYRARDLIDTDSYRPPQKRDLSRDSYYRRSQSPIRHSKLTHRQPTGRGRPLEERVTRPRDQSSDRAIKRRRTQTPSPTRSDRWVPDHRRSSPSRDYPDRRATIDRAFSPRQPSPVRHYRSDPRDLPNEIDSYVPLPRRRDPTPPPSRRRVRLSRSPQRSPSPALRRIKREPSFSPHSARLLKTKQLGAKQAESCGKKASRPASADEDDHPSMDGNHGMRGSYGNRGNMMQNRPSRPFVDTRQQHGGSPPFGTPNSQGSPHSASSYQNRGNWGGNQGHHGPMNNSSPPYRQNSYPPQHHQNQQNFGGHQGHQQPYRGRGRGNYHPNDRRFSGPGPDPPTHPGNYRGRSGHYNNLQWNSGPRRGGPQGPNYYGSHSNSVQPSPNHSQQPSHDSNEYQDEEDMFRPPKKFQVEDQKDTRPPSGPNNQSNTPAKDSKFSFAFKSKATQSTSAKAPPDLNTKARPPPTRPADNRPPTHPRQQGYPDSRNDKDFSRPPDRRPYDPRAKPLPQDRKHPYDRQFSRDQHPRPRSRSPPKKKFKSEPRPRPKLPPELSASESIYYRKPGNESVVGAGTYGKVFKAIHIYTRDKVALKKIRMEGERDGFPITAVREIRLLQHLRHKHVVALQEVMVEKNEAYMVFEYLSHDLTGLINHPNFKLTAAHKKDLAKQMFEGLDFLHRRGVLHRDIKAANILISSSGQLKYADFGLARFYTKSRQLDYTNRVITIWYRPPELLLGETQYGPAVDVWSAACVFMEMFTRKAVFPGEGGELNQLEKVYNVLGTPNRNEWPGIVDLPWYELMQPTLPRKHRSFETQFKDILSPAAMDLLQSCFEYDPTKRPTAEQVLQHIYFTTESPEPKRAIELEDVKGDWHEFESKQHRRGEEKKRKAEWDREREKRKRAEKEAKEGGRKESVSGGKVEESEEPLSATTMVKGEEEIVDESDGEGSARMSMS